MLLDGFTPANSLLAHSEHENVSPTYAEPNAGGKDRLDESRNSWSEDSAGNASDAELGILARLS